MNDPRYINIRHQKRSEEARKKRIAFAAAFVVLYRKRVAAGEDPRGVQHLAANAAGFGQQGFSDKTSYDTQRSMSTRLIKDPIVVGELKRLGMVYDERSRKWHDGRNA